MTPDGNLTPALNPEAHGGCRPRGAWRRAGAEREESGGAGGARGRRDTPARRADLFPGPAGRAQFPRRRRKHAAESRRRRDAPGEPKRVSVLSTSAATGTTRSIRRSAVTSSSSIRRPARTSPTSSGSSDCPAKRSPLATATSSSTENSCPRITSRIARDAAPGPIIAMWSFRRATCMSLAITAATHPIRACSVRSRSENIVGKAWLSYWPVDDVGFVPHESYTDGTEPAAASVSPTP